jgi:hypothetical protein
VRSEPEDCPCPDPRGEEQRMILAAFCLGIVTGIVIAVTVFWIEHDLKHRDD